MREAPEATEGGPRRRMLWSRLAPVVAPALLVGIALHQIFVARYQALNPWKGGGFGMFATTDRGGLRDLRVYAVWPGGEERIPVPPDLDGARLRARDLPSEANLDELGREILVRSLPAWPDLLGVRVEVGRSELDLERRELRRYRLREWVTRVDRDGD